MKHTHSFRLAVFCALAATVSWSSLSQAASTPPGPCSGDEYHQLDFWVGNWKVYDSANGSVVGTSRIEPIMNGCGIKETYDGLASPDPTYSGTSYSSYDRKDGKWHQMYLDINGNVNRFTGARVGSDMILEGVVRGGAIQRMTYRQRSDGSVQQKAVLSTDGGKSWGPGYDLSYRRE